MDSSKEQKGYNAFCRVNADTHEWSFPTGKRIPYLGWFWRDIDFSGPPIPIGETRLEGGAPIRRLHGQQQVGLPREVPDGG